METGRGRWRGVSLAFLALVGVGVALGVASVALPHTGFWHSDEGAKFLQVLNIRLGPDGLDTTIRYPGRALDPNLEFVPFHPKQYHLDAAAGIHLQWPIFLALLTWPFYELLGRAGLYVLPLIGALGACWGSYRLARAVGVPPGWAWAAIPLVGICTPVGFYSWVFFEHTLAVGLVAAAVLLLVSGIVSGERRRLFAAGALLGVAIYLRSELYVLALAVGIALVWLLLTAPRAAERVHILRLLAPVGTWAGGLALALLPLWIFYTRTEGTPLPQHATWYFESAEAPGLRLPPLRYLSHAGLGIIPDFLAGPSAASGGPPLSPWLVGMLLLGLCLVVSGWWLVVRRQWSAVSRQTSVVRREYVIRTTQYAGLLLISGAAAWALFEPGEYTSLHGFLLAAPAVAFALLARPGTGREGDALRLLGGITALYIVLHVVLISALSGLGPISRYEWGQRYLLPAYPLLIALALRSIAECGVWSTEYDGVDRRQPPSRNTQYAICLAFCILALIGAGFLARGWGVLRDAQARAGDWQAAVAVAPDRVLLANDWAVPLLLAPEFYTHTWFLVPEGGAADWPRLAAREGLGGFGTVTLGPTLDHQLGQSIPRPLPGTAVNVRGLSIRHFDLAP